MESRSQCKKVSLQNLWQGGYVPPLRRRKGGSPGRLTSQLLLFRALRPGTSSNKFRHPASAGPLPAQPLAQSPFHLFAPARTHPAGTTHCRLGTQNALESRFSAAKAARKLASEGENVAASANRMHRRQFFCQGGKVLRQRTTPVTPSTNPFHREGVCRDYVNT